MRDSHEIVAALDATGRRYARQGKTVTAEG